MKPKQIKEELLEIAKKLDVKIRKELGSFKSGYCTVNEKKIIILNKTVPEEVANTIIAQALHFYGLDDTFLKPAIRDFIESENTPDKIKEEFRIEIDV